MRLSCVIGENTWELSLVNIVFPDIVKVRAKIVCSAAHLLAMILHAHALFAQITQLETFHCQGQPKTVFCKISVWRGKYRQEFSVTWGQLKISRWLFHSCTIFLRFSIFSKKKSFESKKVKSFSNFPPQIRLFFVQNRKPSLKFSDSKMWWREESEKFSLSYYVKMHLKFRENNTQALAISKRFKFS